MPVSLQRLITEVEESCITEELTRECIQVDAVDDEAREQKKKTMHFRDVASLAFGFKRLAKIDCLAGLHTLAKLQLDNNNISKIENIGHLTNLTWLDLSFNSIFKIEGLEALTRLTDLSLYHNQIATIEGLDTLTNLQVLSIGKNNIAKLENVVYLRRFGGLHLVNLEGNPLCRDEFYRSYVLSHIKHLVYLDYRRVLPSDVAAAIEQHQDVMLEILSREEAAAQEGAEAAKKAAHDARMKEANLEGVERLMDAMTKGDAEWEKQTHIPTMLDGWGDVKDKVAVITQDFMAEVLLNATAKKAEHSEWQRAVRRLLEEQDEEARARVLAFEKSKKHLVRRLESDPMNAPADIPNLKAKLAELQGMLMEQEDETADMLAELCLELDGNYGTLVGNNKTLFAEYFSEVRDNENGFFSGLQAGAMGYIEKFAADIDDPQFPEDTKILLQDKDALMASLQASHDYRMTKIDQIEDRLTGNENRGANELSNNNSAWQRKRNRDRLAEVIKYMDANIGELDRLAERHHVE